MLISVQPGSDVPVTYTLKTKVNWTAAEDELSKVCQQTLYACIYVLESAYMPSRLYSCICVGPADSDMFPISTAQTAPGSAYENSQHSNGPTSGSDTVKHQKTLQHAQQRAMHECVLLQQQITTLLGHMLQVLKRRRQDGSSLIKVDQLRDGVVLFEDVADAERYSNYLEADNSSQVNLGRIRASQPANTVDAWTIYICCAPLSQVTQRASNALLQVIIAECDSHDLFRNVQEVRGVVVLLRKGSNVPMPQQLAVSLRNKQSFEND